MSKRICSVQGCGKPHYGRSFCKAHWLRWWRYGDPLAGGPAHIPHRILVNEDDPDACYGWQGATEDGYARFTVNGRPALAHRIVYTDLVGPIPPGLQIDHRCHNRSCCNPRHLRLATNKQNCENLTGATRRSRSGVRGVCWDRRRQKWRAQLDHNGKRIPVGHFTTLAAADVAIIAKRNELFTHNDADR